MGTETLTLPKLRIDWGKARNFALIFDENPVHISGEPNELLPERTVSGLYAALVLLRHLFKNDPHIICAKDLTIYWDRPVRADDILVPLLTTLSEHPGPRDSTVCRRKIIVHNQHNSHVMDILITQIRRATPSHDPQTSIETPTPD